MYGKGTFKRLWAALRGVRSPSVQVPEGPKLNLGCGSDYREGWDNWDVIDTVRAEAYLDFSKDSFPAEDEKYGEIYSNGVLEQILENRGLMHCMNECHRVLKPGGVFNIVVPDSRYPITFIDPHCCRHFISETFRYFCAGTKAYRRYGSMYGYLPWSSYTTHTNQRGLLSVTLIK